MIINFRSKKNGFMLILTMLLISMISLLVVSVVNKVFITKSLIVSIERQYDSHLVLSNTISFIRNQLSQTKDNKEEKKGEENKKEESNDSSIFKFFWENAYKWKEYSFKHNKDGFDADVQVYLMCEDGKIPLKAFIDEILKEKNKKKSKEENLKDKENKENDKENKENKDNKPDENTEKILEGSSYFKALNKFFETLSKSNSELKKLIKDDKKLESDSNDKMLTELMKKYNAIQNKMIGKSLYPNSLFEFFDESASEINIYPNYYINNSNDKDKVKKNYLGDLMSVCNDKCNLLYISPSLLKSMSKNNSEEEFLTEEKRKKIIDEGQKLMKGKNKEIGNILTNLFEKNLGIKIGPEILQGIKLDDFFKVEFSPKNISLIIYIEKNGTILRAFVILEELDLTDNNKEYIIKQIYLL